MGSESTRVRQLVVEAVEAAAELLDRPAVSARWDEPSALEGMTVGALAAHLVRAAGATIAYLDRTDPDEGLDGPLLTPITYFHFAIDSPLHDQIKVVSAKEADIGPAETAAKCAQLATDLAARLASEPEDRLVGALKGQMLRLDDFCRTRLIEVLTHLDDLATSVDEVRPETDPEGLDIVIGIIVGIARVQRGDWAVLHGLSRAERVADDPVFPVF